MKPDSPCPAHPDAESVGTCARCGRFFCAAEEIALDGQRYCGECGKRADVDWLGAYYSRLAGKRSGFAYGAAALGLALAALATFIALEAPDFVKHLPLVVGFGAMSVAQFMYFTGVKWGRFAPLCTAPSPRSESASSTTTSRHLGVDPLANGI